MCFERVGVLVRIYVIMWRDSTRRKRVHRKESRKEVLRIPERGKEGEDVWETRQRVADTKMPEGLLTSVQPICPHRSAARKRERRKRMQGEKREQDLRQKRKKQDRESAMALALPRESIWLIWASSDSPLRPEILF